MFDQSAKYHEFNFTSCGNPKVQLSCLKDIITILSALGFNLDPPLVLARFMRLLPSDSEQEMRVIKTTVEDPKGLTRDGIMRPLRERIESLTLHKPRNSEQHGGAKNLSEQEFAASIGYGRGGRADNNNGWQRSRRQQTGGGNGPGRGYNSNSAKGGGGAAVMAYSLTMKTGGEGYGSEDSAFLLSELPERECLGEFEGL